MTSFVGEFRRGTVTVDDLRARIADLQQENIVLARRNDTAGINKNLAEENKLRLLILTAPRAAPVAAPRAAPVAPPVAKIEPREEEEDEEFETDEEEEEIGSEEEESPVTPPAPVAESTAAIRARLKELENEAGALLKAGDREGRAANIAEQQRLRAALGQAPRALGAPAAAAVKRQPVKEEPVTPAAPAPETPAAMRARLAALEKRAGELLKAGDRQGRAANLAEQQRLRGVLGMAPRADQPAPRKPPRAARAIDLDEENLAERLEQVTNEYATAIRQYEALDIPNGRLDEAKRETGLDFPKEPPAGDIQGTVNYYTINLVIVKKAIELTTAARLKDIQLFEQELRGLGETIVEQKWYYKLFNTLTGGYVLTNATSTDAVDVLVYWRSLRERLAAARERVAVRRLQAKELAAAARRDVDEDERAQREAIERRGENARDRADQAARREAARLAAAGEPDDAAAVLDNQLVANDANEAAEAEFKEDLEELNVERRDAIDASMPIEVDIEDGAMFPPLDQIDMQVSAQLLFERLGASDNWALRRGAGEPPRDVLVIRGSQDAVVELFERLVGPLFQRWATEGGASKPIGTHPTNLYTPYWTNTVVPLLTAVALGFHNAVAVDALETSRIKDRKPNQQLQMAFKLFGDLARFIVIKALTGNEAGAADEFSLEYGRTQPPGVLATPYLAQFAEYRADPTIRATLGVGAKSKPKTTNNQLLRFDAPLTAPRKTAVGVQTRRQQYEIGAPGLFATMQPSTLDQQKGLRASKISTPLIKMLFARAAAGARKFAQRGRPLFRVEYVERSGRYLASRVDFRSLLSDGDGRRSGRSFESLVSRIFALPLLDAITISRQSDIEFNRPDQWSLQSVGDGIPEDFYESLTVSTVFFQTVKDRDPETGAENDVELFYGEKVDRFLSANNEPLARYEMGVAFLRDRGVNTDPNQLKAREETFNLYDESASTFYARRAKRHENRASARPVDAEAFDELVLPAVLNQLANTEHLYTDDADVEARFATMHRLVAGIFFTTVAGLFDGSLFQRFGRRPSFYRADGDRRFFRSAARADAHTSAVQATLSSSAAALPPMLDSGLSLRLPRLFRSLMSKAIANEKERPRDILTFKKWLKTINGLADELDNPNDEMRTVLVPSDRAIEAFVKSAAYRAATKGKNTVETAAVVRRVVLYHVLSGEYDFAELLKDRNAASLPTELVVAGGHVAHMKVRVVNFSSSKGGSIAINQDENRAPQVFAVSAPRYAKNGIYYIIEGVVDPTDKVAKELSDPEPLVPAANTYGEDLDVEDIYADTGDDDDEEEELGAPPPLSLPPSRARAGKGRTTNKSVDKSIDRSVKKTDNKNNAERDGLARTGAKPTAANDDLYRAAGTAETLLGRSRERQAAKNEQDFAPWRAYLERTGVLAQVDETVAGGQPVHIMVPTPAALEASKIDLATAGADLARAHVGIGRLPTRDKSATSVVTPLTSQELYYLMQRTDSTPLDTLHKTATIEHMSLKTHGPRADKPGASQLFYDDIQFRDPTPIYKTSGGKAVHVHFINRVLHESLADGGGDVVVAPKAETKAKTAAAGATKSSEAESWLATKDRVVGKLLSAKTDADYAAHVAELDNYLNKTGGSDGVLRAGTSLADIEKHFKELRSAVARNQYIDTVRKASAHEAIMKTRARFPSQ